MSIISSIRLNIPTCTTDTWTDDLNRCESKFVVYESIWNDKMDREDDKTDKSDIYTWKIDDSSVLLSSSCILWDIIHAFHRMSCLYYNESLINMKNNDYKSALTHTKKAMRLCNVIMNKWLPRWNPACMIIYMKNNRNEWETTIVPDYINGNMWKNVSNIIYASICKIYAFKEINIDDLNLHVRNMTSDSNPTEETADVKIKPVYMMLNHGRIMMNSQEYVFIKTIKKAYDTMKIEIKMLSLLYWLITNKDQKYDFGYAIKIIDTVNKSVARYMLNNANSIIKNTSFLNDNVYYADIKKDIDIENLLDDMKYYELKDTM